MSATVLLVGLGGLGGPTLDALATDPRVGAIVACSRSAARGEARCNLSRLAALTSGHEARIDFRVIDLDLPGQLATLVEETGPDVVLNTASMQTWWLLDLLPPEAAAPLREAGLGAWLPLHLKLTLAFMAELDRADYRGAILTGSFPDVINCVLGRVGRAPTCGIGNLDEVVPKIQLLAAQRLGVAAMEVEVTLVGHHALEAAAFRASDDGDGEVPPFFVRVEHDGRDVSDEVGSEELVLRAFPLTTGPAWGTLTAASTSRLVGALLSDTEMRLHAPGPRGLPGGYPVVAGSGRVDVAEIAGLTLEEAIAINEASHRFDGIERIEEDGTVVLSEATSGILRQQLGYDGQRLAPAEAAERAQELGERFDAYAASNSVDLARVADLR